MRVVTADEIDRALTFPSLIDALQDAFSAHWNVPQRHHHTIGGDQPGSVASTLLLMPAWTEDVPHDGFLGTKIVSVFPGNAKKGVGSVVGAYLLLDGSTGVPLAVMDGTRLTLWRTAAASALAARCLAPKDAKRMLIVGTGALAPYLVRAHAAMRPIEHVTVWGRRPEPAYEMAAALRGEPFTIEVTDDLPRAAAEADIISCATLSATPVVSGAWLKPGTHLDLVGAFQPTTREADDEAVRRARVFVDTRAGAMHEAGDIAMPLASGVLTPEGILGELSELCRGSVRGRTDENEITLFKSVGTALEDLAAAILVWRSLRR